MGDLSDKAKCLLDHPLIGEFLGHLEITAMTKSFKMVTVQAMLNADCFPGEMGIEELTQGFARIAGRSAKLQADVQADLDDKKALRKYLEKNPVHFWAEGNYFSYEEGRFRAAFEVSGEDKTLFRELVGEIVDWRLSDYLQHVHAGNEEEDAIVCKVSHANKRPILFLPDRKTNPDIPSGWTDVIVEGEIYEANFVKVAVNVMRRKGSTENRLPDVMRKWFGPNAGLPGTDFHVFIRASEKGLVMEPYTASKALEV